MTQRLAFSREKHNNLWAETRDTRFFAAQKGRNQPSDRDPALRLRREGIVRDPPALPEQGGVGDHGRVVPGVDEGDEAKVHALTLSPGGELAPQQAVGGGAARA